MKKDSSHPNPNEDIRCSCSAAGFPAFGPKLEAEQLLFQ
jgi:hypothetical protein